ncbi:glycosyltransferase family 4 protein [Mucilaginibacter pallidiroseus]|uniref:Glycosyltransferase family 4 protein n=1 Tax=Mucilaginibacter pallidiroseus TaxID=2599295 RepID=A0A563U0L1_9SPHI|nr:glycosyltransferase family 4 protein [Mucilaginibacter pallidiroseus]TWR25168.1 glycosyltransferase family 4 protein [Mucilaginibacter pallidiroseus]
MSKKVSLLSLHTFSVTGGIQKMTRIMAHSLYSICKEQGWDFKLSSLYDIDDDHQEQYIPRKNYKGYQHSFVRFIADTIFKEKPDIMILTHVHLSVIGLLNILINPKCKIWLVAHGVEVWRPFNLQKRLLLKRCDKIICVSSYTKQEMCRRHNVSPHFCEVVNNVIDPFFNPPATFERPHRLLYKYSIDASHTILFSLTRLASSEKYKGHDNVIRAVSKLKNSYPNLRYVLAGKYDEMEGRRVKDMITNLGVEKEVIMTGFIEDRDLTDHFLLADLFVLPSKKEGFGIVFIEALACGLPVVCGNADGSMDAIRNGELGTAINPDSEQELEEEIIRAINARPSSQYRRHLQQQCLAHFGETQYINHLQQLLTISLNNTINTKSQVNNE